MNINTTKKTMLDTIRQLRGTGNFKIDIQNSNRHCLLVQANQEKTAYCFSSPIYNSVSGRLVNFEFKKNEHEYIHLGTSSRVRINKNNCIFEDSNGKAYITFMEKLSIQVGHQSTLSDISLFPSLNGIICIVRKRKIVFRLKTEAITHSIRYHPTCFSVMRDKYKPFLSIASIFATDKIEEITPVEITYSKISNQEYEIELINNDEGIFYFEINLYEPKLFQDTTVESLNPNQNNAYGAIAFIGKTNMFGEQWLYSRPDFSKVSDLASEKIEKVFWHIPILNGNTQNVDVYIPQKRFCSFGSTWNKKVNSSTKIASSNNTGRYLTIDVTTMFTSRIKNTLVNNEGLILRKPKEKNNFIAISTGDCYSAPQIMEIKFKN